MYLYYDRYGTLKEQITFNPARVGNSNVNKIFVYWEGVEEFADWAQELALQTRYVLQDNTQYPSVTTFGFSAQPETAELPFDKNQDLKYFKYYKEYKFLTIDIPDAVLSYNGAVKSYIWVLNADKKRILGLGVFAFMVDGDINEVIPDENISLAQWNMISAQLGLLSGSVIDVTCDVATNTLKVYYANGTTAIRNLPPNDAQTTISSDILHEISFSDSSWVQDGEQGYYLALSSSQVGYTDNRFFVQLERDGEYNFDYYNKTGSFVLSDNIFKGSDGSVLLYSNESYNGRLIVMGGGLLSGDILITDLLKSYVVQTTGDSELKVMSQKAVTNEINNIWAKINYVAPEILTFTLTPSVSSYKLPATYTLTSITHKETNIANISGTLTLKRGSTVLKSGISPSSAGATITVSDTVTLTSSGASYTLSGTDKNGKAISKSVHVSAYYTSYIGASTSETISDTLIASLTDVSSSSLSGNRSVEISGESKYVWFVTTSTISSIKSGGFEVPYNAAVTYTYNGTTYNCYRTSSKIIAGSNSFVIA